MSNFLGSHAINMDAKGRLAIPAKVREELAQACGGRIVLPPGLPGASVAGVAAQNRGASQYEQGGPAPAEADSG